ncbi:MAG: hypothetical protein ABSE81_00580 [Candidatus Omnitrophota bacterium]
MALKITLDTNCLFDYFERNPQYIEKLIEFQNEGKIELAITTRVQADTFGKREDSPIWQKNKILSLYYNWEYWKARCFLL